MSLAAPRTTTLRKQRPKTDVRVAPYARNSVCIWKGLKFASCLPDSRLSGVSREHHQRATRTWSQECSGSLLCDTALAASKGVKSLKSHGTHSEKRKDASSDRRGRDASPISVGSVDVQQSSAVALSLTETRMSYFFLSPSRSLTLRQ